METTHYTPNLSPYFPENRWWAAYSNSPVTG